MCVWSYFPLSAVCSYSNQYVSCLHWSGPDNHYSYMVSPQQMQERDRGRKKETKWESTRLQQDERVCICETHGSVVQMLFTCQIQTFFYGNSWIVNVSDQKYVQVTRISVCTRGTSGRRWPFFDQILTCPCRGASQWCRLLSDSYFLIPRLKAKISSAEQRVAFISGVSVFTSPDSLSAVSKIRCE